MKKNSIINWILYGIDFDVALVSCKKTYVTHGRVGSASISVKQENQTVHKSVADKTIPEINISKQK